METYREFINRINGFEKREMDLGERFRLNPSLFKKVNLDNTFKKFYGDTVVFQLDDAVKDKLEVYVDFLYATVPECFSQRLNTDTFHVTLHDLSNSEFFAEVGDEIAANSTAIRQMPWQKFAGTKIKFKSNFVFNMVGTSLVLGVCPKDENNFTGLMQLYGLIDGHKSLNYPLTPHITLAYYNVDGFDARSAEELQNVVNRLNGEIQFEFVVQSLYYQQFESMNDYITVHKLI